MEKCWGHGPGEVRLTLSLSARLIDLTRSYRRSFVDNHNRLQIDQDPNGCPRFASPREDTDSVLYESCCLLPKLPLMAYRSSYDCHSESLHTPSISSTSSETPLTSCDSWYSFPESRFLSDTHTPTPQWANNAFTPFASIHPPLLPRFESQIDTEGFYNQESIIQPTHLAPTTPVSPFDSKHTADDNVTLFPGRMEVPSYDSHISNPPCGSSYTLPSGSLYPITYSHVYTDTTMSSQRANEGLQPPFGVPISPCKMLRSCHVHYNHEPTERIDES